MLKEFFYSQDPQKIRLRQYFLAGVILVSLFSLLGMVVFWFDSEKRPSVSSAPESVREIESGGSRVNPEEMWRFRMEEENKKLRDALQGLQSSLEQAQKDQSQAHQRTEYEQKLEMSLQELQGQLAQKGLPSQTPPPSESTPQTFSGTMAGSLSHPAPSLIRKFSFQSFGGVRASLKTVKNTIPAGAFVRAVLLSGVDASTAMSSAQAPRPMLLRMVDAGTLPRRFKSDLKDCHITAAAHGDLSSERVYARIEKLTCTVRKTGEIVETLVAGYIAGTDGKDGIRGKVVSKDAAFLERSLIGGLFSGLSNIANPQNRQSMVNPFSAGNPKVDAPSAKDMFGNGMAQGATNALDRLSQYYISRAEQLQPVIQVAAGQVVDVVFVEGSAFGSQDVKEKIARIRSEHSSALPENAYQTSPSQQSSRGLSETPSSTVQTFPSGE